MLVKPVADQRPQYLFLVRTEEAEMADALLVEGAGAEHAVVDLGAGVGFMQHARARFAQQFVVAESEAEHGEAGAGIRFARTGFASQQVIRREAPAAPLHHRAAWDVAEDAQAFAGEVAQHPA